MGYNDKMHHELRVDFNTSSGSPGNPERIFHTGIIPDIPYKNNTS
jgi:hypothetical protein